MKPKSIKFAGMTIREAQRSLLFQLYHIYDDREAANIADLVMERITGWRRIDRVLNKDVKLSAPAQELLAKYAYALSRHQPVQYVLNEAWFYNNRFYVDENVLIPRPETEELVDWLLKSEDRTKPASVLDVGTGSGCIAISIQLNWPGAIVNACDLSEGALKIASRNAAELGAAVNFEHRDILDRNSWYNITQMDILVSNPPYIPLSERETMSKHVRDCEPATALFVPDNDPLTFYRALAELGICKLKEHGKVYAELHETTAASAAELFTNAGYNKVIVKTDMQDKQRMLLAQR